MDFAPFLIWNNHQVDVHSLDELDTLIDELSEKGRREKPFPVQLCLGENSGMLMTVGSDISHLEIIIETDLLEGLVSLGPWNEDELIIFFHGDEPVEMEKKYFVPFDDAKAALRSYYKNHRIPDHILWTKGLEFG